MPDASNTRNMNENKRPASHIALLGDGSSVHLQRWAREMAARGWRLSVVTARPAADGDLPVGVAQHVLPPVRRSSDWLWRAPIAIGERCFIGPHSTVEAGATLGRGCVVASHSRVRGAFADFSMIASSPARAVGDVRAGDARWLEGQPAEVRAAYEAWLAEGEGRQAK
ncbi:MAG: hypothetical protein IJR28_02705 [Ottowia sp.]|nr:hypothetical protein [Ottowia sp.]